MTLHGRTKRRGLAGVASPIVIFFGRSVIMVRRYVGHRRGQYLRRGGSTPGSAPLIPARERAAAVAKNNPGLSNVQIAEKAGVSEWTVRDAKKKSGSRPLEPEDDDRPTVDKPPRGELWDDQDDKSEKLIGKDGKQSSAAHPRRGRKVEMRRAGRTGTRGAKRFGEDDTTRGCRRDVVAIA